MRSTKKTESQNLILIFTLFQQSTDNDSYDLSLDANISKQFPPGYVLQSKNNISKFHNLNNRGY